MSTEKIASLTSYLEDKVVKLAAKEVPPRHQHAPEVYREWLKIEIRKTTAKLEDLKLRGTK